MAHEIRQPLGAIESIAYYLSLVLPGDDPTLREQLTRIRELVEQSSWILSNALGLTEARRAMPQPVDVGKLVLETVSERSVLGDPPVACDLASELPVLNVDPGFARALIENILGLFRQMTTESHPARLQTWAGPTGVVLVASTSAPGYRSIAALPPGSALSLDNAQRLALLSGGTCTYSIDPARGIEVRVMLP